MKQAQLQMQFTWIFVIIAGIAFLAFFVLLSDKLIGGSNTGQNIRVLANLESSFKDLRTGKDISKEIPALGKEIDVICTIAPERSELRIGEQSKDIRTITVFSPGRIQGRTLPVNTKALHTPFYADTIVYLTDKEHGYIFLEEPTGSVRELFGELKNISAKLTDTITLQGYPYYRIIAFNTPMDPFSRENLPVNLPAYKDISAVIFTPDDDAYPTILEGSGTVKYYVYKNNMWEAHGSEPVFFAEGYLGAILAEDAEHYRCTLEKLKIRIATVADVHLIQTQAIIEAMSDTTCIALYRSIEQNIYAIRDAVKHEDFILLSQQANILERSYEDVILKDCPQIY